MPTVLQIVRSVVAPLTRTRLFRRAAPTVLPVLERAVAVLSGGRVQLSGLLVPTLVLTSVGAKSGVERQTVVMYTPDGAGSAIIAGTSFARGSHPAWSYNLLAHPDATITVRGRRMPVRAELIGPTERERAWRLIERQWPGYRAYERQSGRTVRLFRLRLRPGPARPLDAASGAKHTPRRGGCKPVHPSGNTQCADNRGRRLPGVTPKRIKTFYFDPGSAASAATHGAPARGGASRAGTTRLKHRVRCIFMARDAGRDGGRPDARACVRGRLRVRKISRKHARWCLYKAKDDFRLIHTTFTGDGDEAVRLRAHTGDFACRAAASGPSTQSRSVNDPE